MREAWAVEVGRRAGSSLTGDRQPASLALNLLNAAASKAGSSLDEAEAVNSQEAEKPTELCQFPLLQARLAQAVVRRPAPSQYGFSI